MKFHILPANSYAPDIGSNEVYLTIDPWNDYSYVTSFKVNAFDKEGNKHNLSRVKIGFVGQTTNVKTYSEIEKNFEILPANFFSLGVSVDYYKDLFSRFDENWRREFLTRLRDVVWNENILDRVEDERVFQVSHLRSISISTVRDQFVSVIHGDILLTDFDFGFCLPCSDTFAGFDLSFSVDANSTPSTNMHALIGRNGVGKTTLLNAMVKSIANRMETDSYFFTEDQLGKRIITEDYFSSIV